MTRYIERAALRDLLAESADPRALELSEVLANSASTELVAVSPVTVATLLPTYETRLAAAATARGPHTRGLAQFVAALRDQDITEMFAVTEGNITGIGLITSAGDVRAVTLAIRSDPR